MPGEVGVLVRGRIGQRANQRHQPVGAEAGPLDRTADLLERRRAGREQQGLARFRDGFQQRAVGDVATRDLVEGGADLLQGLDRPEVERGGEEDDAKLATGRRDLRVGAVVEMVGELKRLVLGVGADLVRPVLRRVADRDLVRLVELELDRPRSGLRRTPAHLDRALDRVVVVDARLRDHPAGALSERLVSLNLRPRLRCVEPRRSQPGQQRTDAVNRSAPRRGRPPMRADGRRAPAAERHRRAAA